MNYSVHVNVSLDFARAQQEPFHEGPALAPFRLLRTFSSGGSRTPVRHPSLGVLCFVAQFYQPLELAMTRHAELVMRSKVQVQRSAQLVQDTENRLTKVISNWRLGSPAPSPTFTLGPSFRVHRHAFQPSRLYSWLLCRSCAMWGTATAMKYR